MQPVTVPLKKFHMISAQNRKSPKLFVWPLPATGGGTLRNTPNTTV